VKRLVLVALASVLLLAACGGGSGGSSSTSDAKAQITRAYERFFSGKTSLSDRIALLQNGHQFKRVIQEFSAFPGASQVSATVKSVTLQGADDASVVFVVKLAGTGLPQQTGTAVKENGKWKVGDEGLCRLIEIGGTAPPQCKD
jgi:ABC-type glycerol-3-phosphate transport system substrate-binding protein